MPWLIDGYNVMHADGRLGAKLSREGFRRAARRFLDVLSEALGFDRAARTTVVFDATVPPGDFAPRTTYRGLRLVFALEDADADSRIEQMIEHEPKPRELTVVSSDRRIRQAASRRRAKPLTAEEFWVWLDDLCAHGTIAKPPRSESTGRPPNLDATERTPAEETAFWLETFRDLETPLNREAIAPNAALLTDAEIAEIQRQVDREP